MQLNHQPESRVKKSLLNARVNLIFYFLMLVLSFFSRKIFLDTLGAEFTGLSGTLQNILGYLNLAELGVGIAIAFNLYKPLQENDERTIIDLLSLFGYIYRKIGIFVAIAGCVIACFLPLIFSNSEFSPTLIIFCYFSYLLSSLYGYFLNYKQILLNADQKAYIVNAYSQGAQIISTLLQMAIAYYLRSYYGVIIVQMLYGLFYCYILERKLTKEYPWLSLDVSRGKLLLKDYPNILKSTKQVFVHRLKDFFLTQSDQILIFAFVNLETVAFYGNYTMILTKLQRLVSSALDGIGASVGNLVAEGNKSKIDSVFWQLTSFRYLIAGFFVYNIYVDVQPFIHHWLGDRYILDQSVVVLLLVYFFISETRGVVDMFNNAYGHYADVWSAWVEGLINVSVTIVAGIYLGLTGILIGKLASVIPIIVFWKPYYLYHDGFHRSYLEYWVHTFRYLVVFALASVLTYYIVSVFSVDSMSGWGSWILSVFIHAIVFGTVYLTSMLILIPSTKMVLLRIPIIKSLLDKKH